MVMKKGRVWVAAAITIFSFITIAWFSCTKEGTKLNSCNNVICLNGGYCHQDTLTKLVRCFCPTGYEGTNCGTVAIDKYLGTWDMMQVNKGSDSMALPHDSTNYDTTYYSVALKKTATPTTFFIYNFANNLYYNNIICTLDSINSFKFQIDTISAYHLLYDNYHLIEGYGSLSADQTTIEANLITKHLTATSNWIHDTFYFRMTHH